MKKSKWCKTSFDEYIFIILCNVIMLGCSTLRLTKCSKFQVVESLEMCSER